VKSSPSLKVEALSRFRVEVIDLYRKFEEDLVTLSKKFGFEVNMWYSPSKIPQPNFKAGRLFLDVDKLYHEQDFKELISQHYPLWNATQSQKSTEMEKSNVVDSLVKTDLLKKNIEFRQAGLDPGYNVNMLDFRQNNGDNRVKRSKTWRGRY
jgi:hypothetical protein